MKVIFCLLWLLMVTNGHPSLGSDYPFSLLKLAFDTAIDGAKTTIRETVLSEDGLSLREGMENLAAMEALCDNKDNVIVGKSCRREFSKLGDCADAPCRVLDWVKNQAPVSLSRFLAAQSYEDIYRTVFGEGIVPLWRVLCECPGVINASIECVKTEFEESLGELSKVDWNTVRSVLQGVIKSGCGEVDGSQCLVEMTELQASIGRVLDNTHKGEEGCLSLRRAEEEITGVLLSLQILDESESAKAYIAECVKLWDELMCDEDCAGEMQDTFYSNCCIKRAAQLLNSKQMRKHFNKLFKNVWSLLSEGSSPKKICRPVPLHV